MSMADGNSANDNEMPLPATAGEQLSCDQLRDVYARLRQLGDDFTLKLWVMGVINQSSKVSVTGSEMPLSLVLENFDVKSLPRCSMNSELEVRYWEHGVGLDDLLVEVNKESYCVCGHEHDQCDIIGGLLDHVFFGTPVHENFRFSRLLNELFLSKDEIDLFRKVVDASVLKLEPIIDEMLLDTSSLMTLASVIFAERANLPAYERLSSDWSQLEDAALEGAAQMDLEAIENDFDKELKLALKRNNATDNEVFGINATKLLQSNFEKDVQDLDAMLQESIELEKRLVDKNDEERQKIATASVKVIDGLTDDASESFALLPSKYRKRADKIEQQRISGAMTTMERRHAEEEIIAIEEKKSAAAALQQWTPTQIPSTLEKGSQCFVRISPSSIEPFKKAVFLYTDGNDVAVTFDAGKSCTIAAKANVASADLCRFLLDVGFRVLAKYEPRFDYEPQAGWYSGTVGVTPSAMNEHEYLIFFDHLDGGAQYVSPSMVKMMLVQPVSEGQVEARDGWRLAPTIAMREFLRRYLAKYPDWPLVRVHREKGRVERVGVQRNKQYYSAIVLGKDRQMALLRFPNTGSVSNPTAAQCVQFPCEEHQHIDEWIYRGSTRFRMLNDDLGKTLSGGIRAENSPNDEQHHPEQQSRRLSRRPMHRRMFELAGAKERMFANRIADQELSEEGRRAPRAQTARKSTQRRDTEEEMAIAENAAAVSRAVEVARRNQSRCEFVAENLPKSVEEIRRLRRRHSNCSAECVQRADEDPYADRFKSHSPFLIPLLLGWDRCVANSQVSNRRRNCRRHVYYVGPCGRRLRNIVEVSQFLKLTNSKLTIDLFSFDQRVRPTVRAEAFGPVLMQDYSKGFENISISVVNAVDTENAPVIDYTPKRFPAKGVDLRTGGGSENQFCSGCSCNGDCSTDACECRQLTREMIARLHPSLRPINRGYRFRRLEPASNIFSGIYECNDACGCDKKRCYNRVVQQPLRTPIQLFKTAEKGWGIRSLIDLPPGHFVCIYAGQIMTDIQAEEAGRQEGDEYFADLDLIDAVMNEKQRQGIDLIEDVGICMGDDGAASGGDGHSSREATVEPLDRGDDRQSPEDSDASDPGAPSDSDYDSEGSDYGVTSGERLRKINMSAARKSEHPPTCDDDRDDRGEQHSVPVPHQINQALSSTHQNLGDAESSAAVHDETSDAAPKAFDMTEYFDEEALFIVDAKTKGNIGRYMNHSCDPNVIVQHVLVDTHDLRLPWVAFFTKRLVMAGDELCWDYNYEVGAIPNRRIDCKCLAVNCRGRLL